MGRLVMLALLALAGWLWWKKKTMPSVPATTSRPDEGLPMVRCQYCGVHLPQTDALSHNNLWYCDAQHVRADQQS